MLAVGPGGGEERWPRGRVPGPDGAWGSGQTVSGSQGPEGCWAGGPPGSQASPREEAKDSTLLPSRDADILVPPVWPQGSPASSSLLREDS